MKKTVEVKVPNIGEFTDVVVIEVLVGADSTVQVEDPLITLESDKASLDIPSPVDGKIKEMFISEGDRVSEGSLILTVETETEAEADAGAIEQQKDEQIKPAEVTSAEAESAKKRADQHAEVLVLGGGPGGYTAAFRAADLGKKVILVERFPKIGGVCLNVGCIPSKVLLHMAKIIEEAMEANKFGVVFGKPKLELEQMRDWKGGVVNQLAGGLKGLSDRRKIPVIEGKGDFISPHELKVVGSDGEQVISFDHAIIATGSKPIEIPGFPKDDRIITSTGALDLQQVPKRMLIIGGGIIGLEMATVYQTLGSKITIVEAREQLIPGADLDLVTPLHKYVEKKYDNIFLETRVSGLTAEKSGIKAAFEGKNAPKEMEFDLVLVAVGRKARSDEASLDKIGVETDGFGHIIVDKQLRTKASHIFAVGDVVGPPMLAHKASYEGRIAAEVICGLNSVFDAVVIPSIAYTDPELAWVGITENEAKAQKLDFEKAVFPWSASGRSLTMGRKEGKTKMIFDKSSGRVIGAGIVGSSASELIAQMALSIEMGCDAQDLSLTIHPHPTLSESITFAAEIFEGTITDLYLPKKKK